MLTGITALVIDDNYDVAEAMALLIKGFGGTVHSACDGESGIEMARAVKPSVVLVIGMPPDGWS